MVSLLQIPLREQIFQVIFKQGKYQYTSCDNSPHATCLLQAAPVPLCKEQKSRSFPSDPSAQGSQVVRVERDLHAASQLHLLQGPRELRWNKIARREAREVGCGPVLRLGYWLQALGAQGTLPTFAGTAGSPTRRGKATFPEQSFVRGVGAFLAPGATGETLTHQEQTPAFKILIKQPESLKQ